MLPALEGFAQASAELDSAGIEEPIVVNLWATWCVPCRRELPVLQAASGEHPDVRFVGVDEGFDPEASVRFLAELGVSYEQFVDVDGKLAEELAVAELPATFVVDADGEIVVRHTGEISAELLAGAVGDVATGE